MFDMKEFYPSIKEKLLWETIRFVKSHISIFIKDIEGIFHVTKSLLYYNGETWFKKGEINFDVTMDAYDGAEVCELIGTFMMTLLSKHINKVHIRLYRDDGLAILQNTSSPEAEKLKKKFQKLFKEKDPDIIAQCNLKITNDLDITLNLNDGSCRPYKKPNEETNYIHVISNHPPSKKLEKLESLEKFHGQLKKDCHFFHHQKLVFWSQSFTMKIALKTIDMKLSYNINNRKETIETKIKGNITLFGSIHHAESL